MPPPPPPEPPSPPSQQPQSCIIIHINLSLVRTVTKFTQTIDGLLAWITYVETTTECLPSSLETTLSVAANLTDFLVLLLLTHLTQSCLTHRPPDQPDDSDIDGRCFSAAASNRGNPAAV